MALLDPENWDIWDYLTVGAILMVVMLVLGYGIGILWQRWRDRR